MSNKPTKPTTPTQPTRAPGHGGSSNGNVHVNNDRGERRVDTTFRAPVTPPRPPKGDGK